MWIGTESGLYIYNSVSGKSNNLRTDIAAPYSLSDNAIYSIYKDKDDGIWIGTYFDGINYFPNQRPVFENYSANDRVNSISGNRVREFCPDLDGNIWIGTEDRGLNLFDPADNTFLPVDTKLRNLYTNIHALLNDGRYLWVSTFSKGLNRYDLRSHQLITYTQFDNPETIVQNSVFALCKDRQNLLWIGTLSGVNVYDYATAQFFRIEELDGVFIMDIMEDIDGNIWIATFHDGLYRFNPAYEQWKHFRFTPENPDGLPYDKTTSLY